MERGLISVDRWAEGSQAYFLTHLHADHTRGLTPAWSRAPSSAPLSRQAPPLQIPRPTSPSSMSSTLAPGTPSGLSLL
ncbi:hypothetical protein NL676_017562 [Syzygium grande]|nr:hypothetical protein NL676_017562 [Syzygium grande]